jgi:hypothetical protein
MEFREFLKEGSYPYIGKVDNKEYTKILDYLMNKTKFLKDEAEKADKRVTQVDTMLQSIAQSIQLDDDKAVKDDFKKFKKILDGYK